MCPEQNLEAFGTVHGIRGASQQVGRRALSESAKSHGNGGKDRKYPVSGKTYEHSFWRRSFYVKKSVEDELKNLHRIQEDAATGERRRRKSSRFLAQLREAFDAFDFKRD